jgi:tRNA (cmo5U34)-methyltransferase
VNNQAIFDGRAKNWDNNPRQTLALAISGAIKEKISFTKKMIVMDFGAGTGLITLVLAPLVKEITAVDTSQGMLGVLQKKIENSPELHNIRTKIFNIEKDTLPASSYDVIVSSMALHHIKDTRATVTTWFQLLKHGGSIAIADLVEENGSFHPDKTGVEHFGFNGIELKEFFSYAGFKNITYEVIYTINRPSPEGTLKEYPLFLLTALK